MCSPAINRKTKPFKFELFLPVMEFRKLKLEI